jgi:hypothetical protein
MVARDDDADQLEFNVKEQGESCASILYIIRGGAWTP